MLVVYSFNSYIHVFSPSPLLFRRYELNEFDELTPDTSADWRGKGLGYQREMYT